MKDLHSFTSIFPNTYSIMYHLKLNIRPIISHEYASETLLYMVLKTTYQTIRIYVQGGKLKIKQKSWRTSSKPSLEVIHHVLIASSYHSPGSGPGGGTSYIKPYSCHPAVDSRGYISPFFCGVSKFFLIPHPPFILVRDRRDCVRCTDASDFFSFFFSLYVYFLYDLQMWV